MKTKLLTLLLLAGSSIFAATHFSIGIGVGGGYPYYYPRRYYAPPPVVYYPPSYVYPGYGYYPSYSYYPSYRHYRPRHIHRRPAYVAPRFRGHGRVHHRR